MLSRAIPIVLLAAAVGVQGLPAQSCDTTCAQIAVEAAVWAAADAASRSKADNPAPYVGVVDRTRWRTLGYSDDDLDLLGSRFAEVTLSSLVAGPLSQINRCLARVPPVDCPAEPDWVYAGVGPPKLLGDGRAEVGVYEIYSRSLGVIVVSIEMRRDDDGKWSFHRELWRTAH